MSEELKELEEQCEKLFYEYTLYEKLYYQSKNKLKETKSKIVETKERISLTKFSVNEYMKLKELNSQLTL